MSAVPMPQARLYVHELIENKLRNGLRDDGIWLGCADLAVLKQAHTDGETGDEILTLFTADQLTAYGDARAKEARAWALTEAASECDASARQYAREARGGDNSGASDHKEDAARSLADDIRTLMDAAAAVRAIKGQGNGT